MRIIIFILFTFHCFNINAQNQPIESLTFSVEALQLDFNEWRKRVEKKHPLLYLYHPKKEIDAAFDNAYASIQSPMSEIDFFCLLSMVSVKINDGHNFINPSSATIQSMLKSDKLLPLDIKLMNGKLFVTNNLSIFDLPRTT